MMERLGASTRRSAFAIVLVVAFLAAIVACSSRASHAEHEAAPARPAAVVRDGDALVIDGFPRTRFDLASRTLFRRRDDAKLVFAPPRIGRGDVISARPTQPAIEDARVAYASGEISEWYEARPNGIEQGFTVTARPVGMGALVVETPVEKNVGLALADGGGTIDLTLAGEATASFRYGALSVVDANGRPLPSSLAVRGSAIRIEIDDTNALYPLTIDPLVWALTQTLAKLEAPSLSRFGGGLATSNDTLLVGMQGYETIRGAFYAYRRSGAEWKEEAFVKAPFFDASFFGNNVALEGDRALIGMIRSAAVYKRIGTTWTLEQALPSVPASAGGRDAAQLALEGNTAVIAIPDVATPNADGGANPPGTVFVYTYSGTVWVQAAVLASPIPILPTAKGEIAIAGDTLILGTGSNVVVWKRGPAAWNVETILEGDTPSAIGSSVAFDGKTLLTGAENERAVYVFERSGTTWTRVAKLAPPSTISSGNFGEAVALRGDIAFVGAPLQLYGGSVYRFQRAQNTWSLAEEIQPKDLPYDSAFGSTIALGDSVAAIGAPTAGIVRGAVYVYETRSALGDACKAQSECASGFCVDGVCCESTCGGDTKRCLRCNTVDTRGRCRVVVAGIVCRAAANDCDIAETCDGVAETCPFDVIVPNGSTCGGGGTCVAGACQPTPPPTTVTVTKPPPDVFTVEGGGCSVGPRSAPATSPFFALVLPFAVLFVRRRVRGLGWLLLLGAGVACTRMPATTSEDGPTATTRSALVWGEKQLLLPGPTIAKGGFGAALAISGNTLAVTRGFPGAVGSVHVYVRIGNNWQEQAVLVGGDASSRFGSALAIDGDTIAVGARGDGNLAGAIFVFKRTNGAWSQEAKLFAPDSLGGDELGVSVAVRGDLLIAGAPNHDRDPNGEPLGAAYVFRRTDGNWAVTEKLGDDPSIRNFGIAVAMTADRLVVGAAPEDPNRPVIAPDLVLFFDRVSDAWAFNGYEYVDELPVHSQFGVAVALEGDRALVAAPTGPFVQLPPPGGAVYAFDYSNGAWTRTQRLVASDTMTTDFFGGGLALRGDRAVIGAFGNSGKGAAYLFSRTGASWAQTDRLVAGDGKPGDAFGGGVALDQDMVIVGAPGRANVTGAVYSIYRGLLGDACTTSEPCATGFCVDGVCCDTACGNGDPNDCVACSVNAGATTNGTCTPLKRVCRAARGECDVAESCDGVSAVCPADHVQANGLVCGAGSGICSGGECATSLASPDAGTKVVEVEGAAPPEVVDGCAVSPARRSAQNSTVLALVTAALVARRRRKRHAR